MNRQRGKHQKKNKNKKANYLRGLALLLLLVIGISVYVGLSNTERSAVETTVPESFLERTYEGKAIKGDELVIEEQKEGKIDKEETDEPEKLEEPEEVIETAVAPERDMSLIVANAESQVYTVYTDLQQGSGFLFDEKGDILTNAHVVKDASFITVKNNHGQEFNGWVIGISEDVDVALVRVTALKGKKPMAMETGKVAVGTDVFALGSPGNKTNTASEGKITATGQDFFDDYAYTDLYEMNATIKEGSSGGPLIDKNTERVIGINSIILKDNPEIGYAIPIYSVANQLKKWIANPKKDVDWAEEFESHVKDAYFEDGLLRTFIEGYYELLIYSLNDNAVNYYTSYILPNSQAETEGEKHITDYSADGRIFSAVKPTIESVDIKGTEAVVEASVVYNYTDQLVKEVQQLTQRISYTIVIDEFGDYQIKQIVYK